jgi:amino-acid N-acetyltransferase
MVDLDQILAITLSGYRSGERQQIIDLLSRCGLHTEDITRERLRDFILARRGDEIVGVIGLEVAGSDGLLRSLAVREAYRKRGVAEKLIAALERYAMTRGVRVLYLLTLTADKTFEARGYRRTERSSAPESMQATREFRRFCPETAVCLRKRIQSPPESRADD